MMIYSSHLIRVLRLQLSVAFVILEVLSLPMELRYHQAIWTDATHAHRSSDAYMDCPSH